MDINRFEVIICNHADNIKTSLNETQKEREESMLYKLNNWLNGFYKNLEISVDEYNKILQKKYKHLRIYLVSNNPECKDFPTKLFFLMHDFSSPLESINFHKIQRHHGGYFTYPFNNTDTPLMGYLCISIKSEEYPNQKNKIIQSETSYKKTKTDWIFNCQTLNIDNNTEDKTVTFCKNELTEFLSRFFSESCNEDILIN